MSPIPLGILAASGGAALFGSYDLLETEIVGSAGAASIVFDNLNTYSNYEHLQIRMSARCSRAVAFWDTVVMQMNSDSTASSYFNHRLVGDTTTANSYAGNFSTAGVIAGDAAGSSSTANSFSASVVDILDFASSSKNTTVRALTGTNLEGSLNSEIMLSSGAWFNTNAVTRMELIPQSGANFLQYSRFSLYGLRSVSL
jgi:hypothetical protein